MSAKFATFAAISLLSLASALPVSAGVIDDARFQQMQDDRAVPVVNASHRAPHHRIARIERDAEDMQQDEAWGAGDPGQQWQEEPEYNAQAEPQGWDRQIDPRSYRQEAAYQRDENLEGFVDSDAGTQPLARQEVVFASKEKPGTVIIDTNERRLYYILGGGRAMRYGIGVGKPGFEWAGVKSISRKEEWPDWRPPEAMIRRRPDLPRFMPGGPSNPLGARAMYLGSSLYRIHGSNEPESIGQAVSSGCIRMINRDVVDLYSRVKVGTKVVVR